MSQRSRETGHRICHINLSAGFRGGERQAELLVAELGKRQWLQRLVVRSGSNLVKRCRDVPGLQIRQVAPNPLTAAFAGRGSALVHAHEARAVYSGWLLKRTARTPFLLTRRIHYSTERSTARRRAYRAADCVIAVSESIAETVRANYPGMTCQIVPDAHAGMPSGNRGGGEIRARFGGKTLVGHVGELDHGHKGQGTIIEVARRMKDSHPDLSFVLVGAGKDEQQFRRAARGLSNVEFAGFVDNVADYLAAFDVFVYPSLFEGLGSTLLDAMAFGLPVVASNVGGIPEVVEDGVNGLLIPPENPQAMLDALNRVLTNADLRASMARANKRQAAAFSTPRMTDGYEAIYNSILSR